MGGEKQNYKLTANEIWSFPSPLSSPLLTDVAMIGSTIARMGLCVRKLFCDAGATHTDDGLGGDAPMLSAALSCSKSKSHNDTSVSLGGVDEERAGDDDAEVAGVALLSWLFLSSFMIEMSSDFIVLSMDGMMSIVLLLLSDVIADWEKNA